MMIRTARADDARQIAHIHVETWRTAYRGLIPDAVLDKLEVERRAAFWQERLLSARGAVFVAEEGADVTGFCDLVPSRDKEADAEGVAEIAAIYVLPRHWRKGAGRALCESAVAEARRRGYKSVTLWVLASNEGAKAFYEAMGFSLDGGTKTERMPGGHELNEVRFRMAV
jgi:ribosomal protein S18 acetylase RimI-like enzyme